MRNKTVLVVSLIVAVAIVIASAFLSDSIRTGSSRLADSVSTTRKVVEPGYDVDYQTSLNACHGVSIRVYLVKGGRSLEDAQSAVAFLSQQVSVGCKDHNPTTVLDQEGSWGIVNVCETGWCITDTLEKFDRQTW